MSTRPLDEFQTQECCSNCLHIQNARAKERERTHTTINAKKKKKKKKKKKILNAKIEKGPPQAAATAVPD